MVKKSVCTCTGKAVQTQGMRKKVFILSDANALQFLARSKNSSSRFYEQAILLTSYPNLEVLFLPGKFLTLADILSRAFNSTFIEEKTPLSEKMAAIVPPVPTQIYQDIQKLTNEQLTDYLLSDSASEFVDISSDLSTVCYDY